MQLSGSVNTQIVGNPAAGNEIINAVDVNWFANVYGTPVDTQPQPFPTVRSSIPLQAVMMYRGLSKSYLGAAYGETPTHRELQFATQDIPSVQLSVRRGLAPDVIARWQLAQDQLQMSNT